MSSSPQFPASFKTRQQIAQEYGLSYSTFWRRLKYHKIELPPGLINLKWQKEIYEKMGYPPEVAGSSHPSIST
jgi:hypothetical protein